MGSWRIFVGDFFQLNPNKANTKLRVKMILCKGICFLSFQKEMAGYRKNASLSYRSSISSIYVERRNRRLMVICPIPKNIFQGNYMLEEHCEQGWKRFWESFLIPDVGGHTQGQLVLNLTPVRVWSSSNVNKRSWAWEPNGGNKHADTLSFDLETRAPEPLRTVLVHCSKVDDSLSLPRETKFFIVDLKLSDWD